MKVPKSNIVQHGNATIAQITMLKKDKFDRYFENWTSHPGYVYDFNTQSLLMFKGNLKYKGDIQLVTYIDFQTTWPTVECLDLENRKMFAVL